MRKLMWFTIGFGMACGLCAYVLPDGWMLSGAVLCLAACVFCLLLGKRRKAVRILAVACMGCALGLLWFWTYSSLYLRTPVTMDGKEYEVTLTASDYSYDTAYGIGVDGVVLLEGKPYQVRAYINEQRSLSPGDIITGTFRFRVTTPDGAEEATYHQGKGIFLLCYQRGDVTVTAGERVPWWCSPAVWRQQIKDILQAAFPEDVFPFVKALLLGDATDLDYGTDTAFKISGIRHIIAVSGLHISILYSLLSFVAARRRWLTALLGLPTLLLFAAVAGFTPSVNRACIMIALMMLATLVGREYDPPTELAFACLVMLAGNPLVITSVSFQLSVGCVAGIQLFNVPIHNWLKAKFRKPNKLQIWLCTSVSVTLSAMTLTTPLSAWYFGAVSLVSPLTNLLTLWVVNLVFNGILAVCIVSLISAGFAAMLGWLLAWPCRYVLVTAKALASLPLAAVYTESVYITAWLVFCYILLAVFLTSRKKQPGVLTCCGCLGLCFALLASWTEPMLDDTRLTVLDVGQGQSILLQSEGKTYLIDCGGDSDPETADLIAETLLSQGVSHIDAIIITHTDRDHAGAVRNLLTRIDTDLLFLPPESGAAEIAAATKGEAIYVAEDMVLTSGNTQITIFAPTFSFSDNENSLCILFERANCAILVTGDRSDFGERMLLRHTDLPDVDVLIAGHHGSQYSTSEELLQAVTPETVIISAGQGNPYGHPAQELLERLANYGCTVYRTDLQGTIIYRG